MNLNAAAYWIAVGVLALGLNSEYREGRFVALHQAADRAAAVLCQATVRAEDVIGNATSSGRDWSASWDAARDRSEAARAQREMAGEQARARAEFVRDQIIAQSDILRAQAEMRRGEMEQLRWLVQPEANFGDRGRHIAVICPKTGPRVVVGEGSDLDDDMPAVAVSDNF